MSLPRKYPPQFQPEDWNAMVDRVNGFAPSGNFVIPCNFILSFDGTYYAANNSTQIVYGGEYWDEAPVDPAHSGSGNGVDGTDSYTVLAACITALASNGGNIVIKGPMEIAGLDSLTHDINLFGLGEVEITTSSAGATGFTLAESASLNNIYLKENGNDPRYWYRWTTAYSELIKFTDFPSNAGVATGVPEMVWDGTVNMEGAGYIANSLGYWVYDAGGAQSYCQLTGQSSTAISVKNVGGSEYRDLWVRNLYLSGANYILPQDNMFIQTPDDAGKHIFFKSYSGGGITCADCHNGVFDLITPFLSGEFNLNGQYLNWWPTLAGSAVPGGNTTGWIKIKIADQVRYVPFYTTV
jgi:hypothetical protein